MSHVERFWWLVDRGFYNKYVVQYYDEQLNNYDI